MSSVWWATEPLAPAVYEQVKLRTIFECCRWDPQVEDVTALATFALVLKPEIWNELASLSETLFAESLAAEQELIGRPELHRLLGIPRTIVDQWKHPPKRPLAPDVRVTRFDFHWTTEGWRISEANADVPGGYIEASGFSRLMAEQYPTCQMVGDPAQALAQAISRQMVAGKRVAMVHATAYTDDRQVALFLAKHMKDEGLETALVSPSQLCWDGHQMALATDWEQGTVDFVYRFFPAEWLPNFHRAYRWQTYFNDQGVPCCNPTTTLLVQSKRFPVVWDILSAPVPTWRALLPETRDPRTLGGEPVEQWIFKPVFGRVGEDIAMAGITSARHWRQVQRATHRFPNLWAAQRRFELMPVTSACGIWYPCVGVYVVDGKAVGAYGRLGRTPLIDSSATDVAILMEQN